MYAMSRVINGVATYAAEVVSHRFSGRVEYFRARTQSVHRFERRGGSARRLPHVDSE